MRAQRIGGYTLIELLTAISISAIALTAIPAVSKILDANRHTSQLYQLKHLLSMVRSTAISSGKTITLCGTMNGTDCVAEWVSPTVLIFEDKNNNHRFDTDDHLIFQQQMPNSHWYWQGSDKPYLRYRADGSAIEWGHFTLCPSDRTLKAARVTLNIMGRFYVKDLSIDSLPPDEPCT